MTFWDIYSDLCVKNKETPNGVANKLGFSSAICTHWKQKGNTPSISKLKPIAEYFNVSVEYLEGKTEISESEKQSPLNLSYHRVIPVFESVSAGMGINASDYVIDYIVKYIRSDLEASETMGIKVKGNSMYPKIEDGDIIIVHKQFEIDNKKLAVVRVDDSYLVKQFIKENDRIILHSLNPEYQDKEFIGEDMNRVQIVGQVTAIQKDTR